jgi:hypothetical protein
MECTDVPKLSIYFMRLHKRSFCINKQGSGDDENSANEIHLTDGGYQVYADPMFFPKRKISKEGYPPTMFCLN